jgi:flagellar motor component MotA
MTTTEPHNTSLSRAIAIIGLVNGVAGILLQYVLFQPCSGKSAWAGAHLPSPC